MTVMTYGKVDWDQRKVRVRTEKIDTKAHKMDFPNGLSTVRFVSAPHECPHHYWTPSHPSLNPAKMFKSGFKIKCTADKNTCHLCQVHNKIVQRNFLKVISRRDNAIKIVEFSEKTCDFLQEKLFNNKKWGPLTGYDVDVTVDKSDPKNYYSFQGDPGKEPLTVEEIEMINKYDDKVFNHMIAPMHPDDQLRYMEALIKKACLDGMTVSVSALLSGGELENTEFESVQ
jgi:hypothetical protein